MFYKVFTVIVLTLMYVGWFVACNDKAIRDNEDGVFGNALVWFVAYAYTVYWTLVV